MDFLTELIDTLTDLDWRSGAVWIPLLLGLLAGWGLELLFDLSFLRPRLRRSRKGQNDLQIQVDALTEDRRRAMKDAEGSKARVSELQTALSRLATDLRKITSERNQLKNDLDLAQTQISETDTQMFTPDVDVEALRTRAEEAETRIVDLESVIEAQKQNEGAVEMPAVTSEEDQNLIAELREQLTAKENELTELKAIDPVSSDESGLVDELSLIHI